MKNTLLNSGLLKTGGSIVALLLVLGTGNVLAQDEAIGTILLTKGSVEAVSASGDTRVLRRRSEVFAEETVLTGADGFAQIRMVDSAIIALKENTEFRFDEYNFDGEGGAADQAIMNLVQGGFRTVDGLIGSGNSDEYRVDTQYASIGVRGTTHEAVIDPGVDALFTGVWDGGTTVSNGQGAIDLGVGGNFDFSRTDAGDAPQGLLEIPVQLGNIAIAQNPNLDNDDAEEGEGEEEGDDTQEATEQTDGNDDQDDGNNDGDDGFAATGTDDEGNDETREVLNDLSEEASNNPSLGSNSNGNAANAPGNAVATAATSNNPSTDSPVTDTEGNSSTNVDVQINPANNARNANALSGNNNAGGNGNNSDDGDDSPGNSGNAGGGNGNNSDDDSPGNSGNAGGGNNNGNGNNSGDGDDSPGNSGNAGGGNGNNNGGGNNSDDGTDGGDDSPGNSGNAGGGNGNNNGGGNNSDDGTDGGDDSPGNSGNSGGGNSGNSGGGNNADDGTDGSTDGGDDSPGNSGNSGGGNSGNSGGGNSGNGGGGNSGNSGGGNGNGNLSDSGIELDENGCAIVLEVCEQDAEPPADGGDETDGTGNGNSGNGGGGNSNNNAGGNSNNSSSGLQQSSDATVQALVENYASAISGSDQQIAIVNRGDATLLAVAIPADAEGSVESSAIFKDITVDWGYWTLPGLVSGEQEVSKAEFQRVYLAVVDPANMDDLKSVSGNWQYSSVPNQFTGSGTAGTLTGLDMAFDVDLNSGSVSNGSFAAEVAYGAESWSMNFTGSVNGATATMGNFTDASVVTPAGIINGVEGSLGGVFTGAGDTNGFVSGFALTNGIGSALGGLGLLEGSPQ